MRHKSAPSGKGRVFAGCGGWPVNYKIACRNFLIITCRIRYTLREVVILTLACKRKAVCYGTGTSTIDSSLRGATNTGTRTLCDHPSGSGKGNHASGGSAYSADLAAN